MLLLLLFALLAAAAAFLLFKFATVDGDFTLVSRGPPRREKVNGKVVWITGASRGIGEVLAMQLATLGANLILSARNKDELERVKHNIVGKHPSSRVEVLPMDLSSGEESLKEVVHVAESIFSNAGVDYMIHNAAFERPKRGALEETEESLKATFNVNVFGTMTLTRFLVPSMLDRGMGHFVVMSSAAGKVPSPGQALYTAAMALLFALDPAASLLLPMALLQWIWRRRRRVWLQRWQIQLRRRWRQRIGGGDGRGSGSGCGDSGGSGSGDSGSDGSDDGYDTPPCRPDDMELQAAKRYGDEISPISRRHNNHACAGCHVFGAIHANNWLLAYGQDMCKTTGCSCEERQHL